MRVRGARAEEPEPPWLPRPEPQTALSLAMRRAIEAAQSPVLKEMPTGGGSPKKPKLSKAERKQQRKARRDAKKAEVIPIHRGGQKSLKLDPAPEIDPVDRELRQLLHGMSDPLYVLDPTTSEAVDLGDNTAEEDDSIFLQAALRYGNPIWSKIETKRQKVTIKNESYPAPQRVIRKRMGKGDYRHVPDELIMTEVDIEKLVTIKGPRMFGGTKITEDERARQKLLKEELLGWLGAEESRPTTGVTISGQERPNPRCGNLCHISTGKYLDWAGTERHKPMVRTKRFYQRATEPLPYTAFIKETDKVVDSRTRNVPGLYGKENLSDDAQYRMKALLNEYQYGTPLQKPDRSCSWAGVPTKGAWKRCKANVKKSREQSKAHREEKGLTPEPPVLEEDFYLPVPRWWWFLQNPSGKSFLYDQVWPSGIVDPNAATLNEQGRRRVVESYNNKVYVEKGHPVPEETQEDVAVSLAEEDDGLQERELDEIWPKDLGVLHGPTRRANKDFSLSYIRSEGTGLRTMSGWDFSQWMGTYEWRADHDRVRYEEWLKKKASPNQRWELYDETVERFVSPDETEEQNPLAVEQPTLKEDGVFRINAKTSEELEDAINLWEAVKKLPAAKGSAEVAFPLIAEIANGDGRFVRYDLTTYSGLRKLQEDRNKAADAMDRYFHIVALLERLEEYALGTQGVKRPTPKALKFEPFAVTTAKRYMDSSGPRQAEIEELRRKSATGFAKVNAMAIGFAKSKRKWFDPQARGRGYIQEQMAQHEAIQRVLLMARKTPAQLRIHEAEIELRNARRQRIRELSAVMKSPKHIHRLRKQALDRARQERWEKQRVDQAKYAESRKAARDRRGYFWRKLNEHRFIYDSQRYGIWLKERTEQDARARAAEEVLEAMIEREQERLEALSVAKRQRHEYLMKTSALYRAQYSVVRSISNAIEWGRQPAEFLKPLTDLFQKSTPEEQASIPPTVGEVESDVPCQPAEENTGPQREEENTVEFVDARRIDARTRALEALERNNAEAIQFLQQQIHTALPENEGLPEEFEKTPGGIVIPRSDYIPPASYKRVPGSYLRQLYERIRQDVA